MMRNVYQLLVNKDSSTDIWMKLSVHCAYSASFMSNYSKMRQVTSQSI